ncbi:MAG: hypothetical protein IPN48_04935 [Sphingomonadales bacterium]|nr:hypothetical protein [Sphingomonadales bacterium]
MTGSQRIGFTLSSQRCLPCFFLKREPRGLDRSFLGLAVVFGPALLFLGDLLLACSSRRRAPSSAAMRASSASRSSFPGFPCAKAEAQLAPLAQAAERAAEVGGSLTLVSTIGAASASPGLPECGGASLPRRQCSAAHG